MSVSDTSDSSNHQHETSAPYNPLEQLIALLTLIDPVEFATKAIDTTRRTSESLITILENLASTVDNLNKTTTRVNSLLDEVEEPLRRVMPQLGTAMNAVAALGETAQQLGELSKRLGPLTTLAENAGGLFGLRPNKPSPPPSTGETSGPTSS